MTEATLEGARRAYERARDLMERVVTGAFVSETKEAAAVADAREGFSAARAVFGAHGRTREEAEALADLGYLELHAADDRVAAMPLLLHAAELFAVAGDRRARLATLLEVTPIDRAHPRVLQAVEEAIAEGLPADLTGEEDPVRLLLAQREAGDLDAAHALAQALIDEASARDDLARVARMLGERAKVEDRRRDRKAVVASFEQALHAAERARSNEETLRALLGLVDACWSSGQQARARELFARAKTIRGVPESLRKLRSIMAMTVG